MSLPFQELAYMYSSQPKVETWVAFLKHAELYTFQIIITRQVRFDKNYLQHDTHEGKQHNPILEMTTFYCTLAPKDQDYVNFIKIGR